MVYFKTRTAYGSIKPAGRIYHMSSLYRPY